MPYENMRAHLLQPTNQALRLLDDLRKSGADLTDAEATLFRCVVALVDSNKRLVDRLEAAYEALEVVDLEAVPRRRESLVWLVHDVQQRVESLERRQRGR